MESLTSHTDYGAVSLNESEVNPNPMVEFEVWLAAAEQAGLYEPNAMVLSTADPEGRPSSRTVLLKGLDGSGFEFVTNYASRKGRALSVNPHVSLLFPWYSMQRQVIVYGQASPTDAATSDAYFAGRPRGSRIAAVASDQSRPVASRALLEAQVRRVEERYSDDTDVPRPENWGGFRVVPHAIEFWQGRTSRLHDRLRFTSGDAGDWTMERLQP
jgi:pyridoxamine 5'-phosphate oxidase